MLAGPDAMVFVVGVEEAASEGGRDAWAWISYGHIIEEIILGVGHSNFLQLERSLASY